ncbi:MAG: thioredoxin fold domain-containing protein [Gammaproteobacteria bacterium]|nr:thioredoxin fold domain-containing protein [Gammaproteobacteria bacterium]MDH5799989.1 thioredoxin fold domain-containing protein [Gammaproteobacteria bacterium]
MRTLVFAVIFSVIPLTLKVPQLMAHEAVTLAMVDDLQAVSRTAQSQNLPILLVYSAEDCGYCKRLEADVLNPMMKNGEFTQRIIVRKVMIDSMVKIKDFTGQPMEAGEFAFKQGVDVTPTLQFVNAHGKQLVPRMVGYQGTDFFPAYLEDAIGSSLEVVRRR